MTPNKGDLIFITCVLLVATALAVVGVALVSDRINRQKENISEKYYFS